MLALIKIIVQLVVDVARLAVLHLRSTRSVAAENLFLRRQLGLFKERGMKPRRVDAATRISLAVLSRLFDWRDALLTVTQSRRNLAATKFVVGKQAQAGCDFGF